MGNLDIKNIYITDTPQYQGIIKSFFKKNGIVYSDRTKMVKIIGQKIIENPFVYVGADDKVGVNYTGQWVVESVYAEGKELKEP